MGKNMVSRNGNKMAMKIGVIQLLVATKKYIGRVQEVNYHWLSIASFADDNKTEAVDISFS